MENKKSIAYRVGQALGTIFCGFGLAFIIMAILVVLQEVVKGMLYIIAEWKIQFSASVLIVLATFLTYGMTKIK